jgi:hypothetical protein
VEIVQGAGKERWGEAGWRGGRGGEGWRKGAWILGGKEAAHYGEWRGRRGAGWASGEELAVENRSKSALVAGMRIHGFAI